jgi:hypothetical protein
LHCGTDGDDNGGERRHHHELFRRRVRFDDAASPTALERADSLPLIAELNPLIAANE